ncbi:MAG TPA: CocE/NonD family hydrolase [Sphingomicrobium sp.]|nr:CocE/NonD family hydrolase [Sphingomicrobium sp.]
MAITSALRNGRNVALAACLAVSLGLGTPGLTAQPTPAAKSAYGTALEHHLIPMRDGVKLDTSVFLPKGNGPFPAILVRTPYPMSDPREAAETDFMRKLLDRGYAIVQQNERGLYFSEGRHRMLVGARNDGYDTVDWITKQGWSDGGVGTWGCSSTAENQLGLITANHPAHKAAVALGYGAGIGRIGPYAEQGNQMRGGAQQLLFATWFRNYLGSTGYGSDERPTFPSTLTPEDRTRLAKLYSLRLTNWRAEADMKTADLMKFYRTLPVENLIRASGGPKSEWDEYATRGPASSAWQQTDFVNEGDTFGVPTIWGVSWYDVGVAPNLYLYDYAKDHIARGRPANEQFLIVGPGTHCTFQRTKANEPVGEMDVGDATYDYDKRFIDFFDWKLKGVDNGASREPRVRIYQMGENRWVTSNTLEIKNPRFHDFYLASQSGANSVFGDGLLTPAPPSAGRASNSFTYDPRRPVPTVGGGACCMGTLPAAGGFDQADIDARNDVLVFTTPALAQDMVVRGPVGIDLYVSSTAPDTDFAVKLVDVHPDGAAYNIDDTIFRARYRDGYDKPTLMQPGKVYKITIPPMFTANTFRKGHRVRVQVTSSNFPRYDRNLNTGGPNYNETASRVAVNTVHHSAQYPSRIRLSLAPAR